MHLPEAVANYFIRKAWDDNRELTPIQILKLAYIAHGWTLGYTGKPLVSHEIMAWKYGPVIPSLYYRFKNFGNQPVDSLAQDYDSPYTSEYSTEERIILEAVWVNYGEIDGMRLSTLTHEKGTPWYQVWVLEGGAKRENAVIANEKITEYYKALIGSPEPVNG